LTRRAEVRRILDFQKHDEFIAFRAHATAISFGRVDHTMIARDRGDQVSGVEESGRLSDSLAKALESDEVTLIEYTTASNAFPPIALWKGHDVQLLGVS
jgi:acetolactate synthase-1/2/3 large subunit